MIGARPEAHLVHQQEPGLSHQGPGQGQHLLLATGEQAGLPIEQGLQLREQAQHPLLGQSLPAPTADAEAQVLTGGQVEEERPVLGDVADAPPSDLVGRPGRRRSTEDLDGTVDHRQQARHRLQRRRLARAVGTEQGDDLALGHGQVEAPDHGHPLVAGDQAPDVQAPCGGSRRRRPQVGLDHLLVASDLLRGPVGDDRADVEDHDPVTDPEDQAHVVVDQQDADPVLGEACAGARRGPGSPRCPGRRRARPTAPGAVGRPGPGPRPPACAARGSGRRAWPPRRRPGPRPPGPRPPARNARCPGGDARRRPGGPTTWRGWRRTRRLSTTERSSNSSRLWKVRTNPRRARSAGGRSVTSSPAKCTEPADSGTKPVTASIRVVLPAPLGPIRPTNSPSATSRSTSWTACSPPKVTVSPLVLSTSRSCPTRPTGGRGPRPVRQCTRPRRWP